MCVSFKMFIFALGFDKLVTDITKIFHLIRIFCPKMNIKTNLLEEYVNFVDTTKKQNK